MKHALGIVLLVYLFLFFNQINISFAENQIIELEKIVVTASGIEAKVKDVPNKVTVVGSKDIESQLSKNVDDLLQDVCGIDVSRRTGFTSSTSTVTLRGFGGQARGRTLVLIDGLPFNEIYGGEVYWNAIPIEDIERIEVVPGAISGLYGPGAMGGVVNIITKKPLKRKIELNSEYGDFATRKFNLNYQDKWKKFRYSLSGEYFKTNGYVAALPDARRDYDIRRSKENKNFNLKLFHDFNEDSEFNVGYRHYDEDVNGGRRYYYGSKDLDNLNMGFKRECHNFGLQGNAYFNWDDSSWTYDRSPYTYIYYVNTNPKNDWGLNLQADYKVNESNRLLFGTDYRWGKINSKDEYKYTAGGRIAGEEVIARGRQQLVGLYLQDEIRFFNEKLIFNLGGRFDWWKSFDGYLFDDNLTPIETNYDTISDKDFSPKIGLVYHLDETTTLRSSFGKGFRAPTLYDLYRTWKYGTTTYQSNPNLGSEYTYSYEVGLDKTFWEKFLSRLTFYYSDARDFIYSVDVGGNTKEKQNVGKVEIYGLELETKYDIFKVLSIFANYTFNRSEIREFQNDRTLEGKLLTYTPKDKVSFGFVFNNPKLLKVDLRARYTGHVFHDDRNTQKLKSHLIWDFALAKEIGEHLEISLKIENMFDKTYQEYKDYLAPPRFISGNLKLKF